jgi:hypothetical protein
MLMLPPPPPPVYYAVEQRLLNGKVRYEIILRLKYWNVQIAVLFSYLQPIILIICSMSHQKCMAMRNLLT